MQCPVCGNPTSVIDSRKKENNTLTVRRRGCSVCHHRFSTVEMIVEDMSEVREKAKMKAFEDSEPKDVSLLGKYLYDKYMMLYRQKYSRKGKE